MEKLVAIDGNSIMNRAFYGVMNSKLLMTSDGVYTNAIFGFLSILFKLINEEKPEYICVAFDLKAPTFRHKKYDGYKATRKGMPDELRVQMPLIKEVLRAMNIKVLELEGYEADDILGTMAKYGEDNGIDVLLLTGDRDALQLSSERVTIRIPTTRMGKTESTDYTPDVIREKFGIEPIEFIQIKGLMGDTSDNIPGVPGVGEKTAFSLITKFHNIDFIYDELEKGNELDGIKGKLKEKIVANKELAILSRELGTIFREVPLELDIKEIARKEYDPSLFDILARLQLKTFIEKFGLTASADSSSDEKYKDEELVFEDFSKLDLKSTEEISYYFSEDFKALYLYANGKSYAISNPSDDILKSIFESQDLIKIGFEEKESYLHLKKHGVLPQNMMFDIAIASYLLNPSKSSYKLDDIIFEILNVLVEKKEKQVQISLFETSENDDEKEKNAKYAKYIYDCKQRLEVSLKEKNEIKLFNEIEMPLMKVLAEMEFEGVKVDRSVLENFDVALTEQINVLTSEITELAGETFNINSTKKLSEILFEKLKLTASKKTKSGYSTDSEVLESIVNEHPIVRKVLDYRTLTKLKATYIDGMLPLIQEDGRIHAKFNQTVTATGRISCTEPNLQNIPIRTEIGKELRNAFVANDGAVLIDADYSQIELRVLAHISDDENMINAFNNDVDVHAVTASQVFKVPLDEVTKQMRSDAKAVNFGIVYGISDYGLSANINSSVKKAREYIEKYFETYPGIKAYMDDVVKNCKEDGFVETLWGRRRYVPEINSSNYNIRQFGERVAKNAPIQGAAADIIKIAMINVHNELNEKGLKSKLILQVHDELLIEAKADEVEVVKELLVRNMQDVANLKVKLEVDVNTGKTWLEAH